MTREKHKGVVHGSPKGRAVAGRALRVPISPYETYEGKLPRWSKPWLMISAEPLLKHFIRGM
jgi:hypothetical protein